MVFSDVQGKRLLCRPAEKVYFQFGGTIYLPGQEKQVGIPAGQLQVYSSGSVVIFSPHLRQE